MFHFIRVAGNAAAITLGAATATASLPHTSASGNNAPRFVRLTATEPAYVTFYDSVNGVPTVDATHFQLLVNPNESIIIACQGYDSVAALQAGTGGVLAVQPVEA